MISHVVTDWRHHTLYFAHPSDSWISTLSSPAVRSNAAKWEIQYSAANGCCKYLV